MSALDDISARADIHLVHSWEDRVRPRRSALFLGTPFTPDLRTIEILIAILQFIALLQLFATNVYEWRGSVSIYSASRCALVTSSFRDSSLSKITHGLMSWRKQAAWAFLLSFIAVLLVAILLPNKYSSHLKILVKNERANSLISVGDQTQGLVYLNDVSEARINTEIELLNSGDLLRQVVERCGLANLVSPRVKGRERREGIAVHNLQKALTVAPAHRSDVIEVTYQSGDPNQSAAVLQALSNIYQATHLELHGAPGSYAFFYKMWKDTSGQLDQAADELEDFRQSSHIVSLPEEKSLLLQQVTDLQKQVAESAADTSKSEEQANSYQNSLSHMTTSIEKENRSIPNQQSVEQLSTMLVTLQNKRTEAIARYLPEDRIIKELDAQIKLTQDAIEKSRNSPAQEVASGVNPTFLNVEGELVRATADYAGGLAQANSLRAQIRRDQGRLTQLNAITADYDNLVRHSSELSNLRETYRKKMDEANVSQLLDKQNLSNIAIVEQPVVERIATSPRRGIIVALGFIWSLAFAAGIAVVLDLMNGTICAPFELEAATGVMLLAVLPRNAQGYSSVGCFPELYLAMQRSTHILQRESP